MLKTWDLHNHSCLSPCGDLDMSPTAMAAQARRLGIDILALTDHNSAKNCPAFAEACKKEGISPIFGLELNSREEAHCLALFTGLDQALELDKQIYPYLPNIKNDVDRLGYQLIVDLNEDIIDQEEKALLSALNLSIEDLCAMTNELGGYFVPAHIDRSMFSLLTQLGFVPDLPFAALEITKEETLNLCGKYPAQCSSDAHYLHDMGKRSFQSPATSLKELYDDQMAWSNTLNLK